jgi:uncharacterized protein
MQNQAKVIKKTEEYVHTTLEKEGSGHDWFHIQRVRNNALAIGRPEGADLYIVNLAALLHDIADWKSHEEGSMPTAIKFLEKLGVDQQIISQVGYIIDHVSFKGIDVEGELVTLEAKVVQDADRLDALGAIGIARCFTYGGSKGILIHDPLQQPHRFDTQSYTEAAKQGKGTSINHFYEKLLLLKDLMKTESGRSMAQRRHEFMELFLQQFYIELEGSN